MVTRLAFTSEASRIIIADCILVFLAILLRKIKVKRNVLLISVVKNH